ncbi:MAG: hypothetical protein ACRD0K_16820 [Egibacteraceae bacterium]
MRSWAASVLVALLGAVALLLTPAGAPLEPPSPYEETAWHACGDLLARAGRRNECGAGVTSPRATAPVSAQVPAVLAETARAVPGVGPFTGGDPSRIGRCGPSPLAFLQIFRC